MRKVHAGFRSLSFIFLISGGIAHGMEAIEDKRTFIQSLLNYDFELTQKDSEFLKLEFYDGLPANQREKMVYLLCDHKEGDFSMLPPRVRKFIIHCMMRPYLNNSISCLEL